MKGRPRRSRPRRGDLGGIVTGSPNVCIRPGRKRQKIAPEVRAAVLERDGHACVECRAHRGDLRRPTFVAGDDHSWARIPSKLVELTMDHIVPVAVGGCSHAHNLRVLCFDCNMAKGSTVPAGHTRRGLR